MPRGCGNNIGGPHITRRRGSSNFAMMMHHATVSNRPKQCRKGQIQSQYTSTQITLLYRNCVAWPKNKVVERLTVCPQRYFIFRSAINVVEHHPRQSFARKLTQIFNVNGPARRDT